MTDPFPPTALAPAPLLLTESRIQVILSTRACVDKRTPDLCPALYKHALYIRASNSDATRVRSRQRRTGYHNLRYLYQKASECAPLRCEFCKDDVGISPSCGSYRISACKLQSVVEQDLSAMISPGASRPIRKTGSSTAAVVPPK